jgi:hypothetical protein
MSDSTEAGVPAPTPEPTPAPAPTPPALPEAVNLQNSVKERLVEAEGGDKSARERVVSTLVEQELERRAGVLTTALGKRKELDSAFRKIKPDQVTVDAEGVETAVFTKSKHTERKKSLEKLNKLDGLINKVIGSPSAEAYKKLGDFK